MINSIIIRIMDVIISLIGLLVLSPVFLLVVLFVSLESKGGSIYRQIRVGKDNIDFSLFKFRTMYIGSDYKGLITVGTDDSRITKTGRFLRKYKIDELPQLYNVLIGDMCIVGPRPEVRKYVSQYNEEQKIVLSVKPGITDYASIKFSNENEILSKYSDYESAYINIIIPAKIELNMIYIERRHVTQYVKVIFLTFWKILKK